ncbi:hypothetical protein SUGI_0421510 [Cryptomeria japonica]|uniref:uncharacterized protein LOC131037760 n=1 Tax=Cryptomeria japonica TaxID=3369 RepID=UPI00240895CF|nr:uncharacterized protein LOC131037760 [Cryptomeria japonica]GLJ22392.1 hypothetical protein SUGI_0421510 [Cryptomeria japonica]
MVGFIKKILGHLGFIKEDNNENQQHQQQQQPHHHQHHHHYQGPSVNNTVDSRQGFKMKVAVPTETAPQGPVVYQCWGNDGGVQGFGWYTQKLQADEDGDIAEEFLNEVLPDVRGRDDLRVRPRLEVKHSTKPVTLKGPVISMNGNVHPCVEHAGKLQLA